ncbi:MAG: LamG-like jellyroll fold domain-containing protein [Clostridia bacterium]
MKNRLISMLLVFAMVLSLPVFTFAQGQDNVLLHYDFDGEITEGVNYGAVIKNGYAYFDGTGDYIHMPDNIVSGCENVTFVINVRPEMDGANQFTFTVGTSDKNYLFLNTNNGTYCRFAISTGGWQTEEGKLSADPIEKGNWASIAIVMEGKTKRMYVDGALVGEVTSELIASSLGDTDRNYLAKSQYSADSYFKGYIEDFRIYDKALTSDEVIAINSEHKVSSEIADVYIAAESLEFESYKLTENINLPTEYEGMTVTWKSDNEAVLTSSGVITRTDVDTLVNLTATFSDANGNSVERIYEFTVIHNYTDADIAQMDLDEIHIFGNLEHLKENLYLPTESTYGSTITWVSEDETVITNEGIITRAPSGEGEKSTNLTAYSEYNGETVSKSYTITVEEEDFAYLFAYFTGNASSQEKMYYGLSRDGYHFNTINNGNSVLESTKGHQCMRDPFIMKGQNGMYYALFTDMRSSDGWSSQSSIIIFESDDLINWDDGTIIDFKDYGWTTRAWAPQAIWDSEFYDEETGQYGAYMIYLALSSGGTTQMYKVYSHDMKTLITEPELLYRHAENGNDIDGDIIYKDGLYYMYVKNESAGGICVVTSEHAGGPYSDTINTLPRKNSSGSNVAIEGSGIFKMLNEDKYHIIYDAYNDGFFIMTETEDLVNFTQFSRSEYSFDFTPRHGYVIPVSKSEVDALEEIYGKSVAKRDEAHQEPIIYYDFEDDLDKSGNDFNAQLSSNATIAQGISGKSGLVLDGTSESYVTIPSEAISGLEDYTISAWIKPESKNTTQRVFDFGTGTDRYMFLTPYYKSGILRGAITAGSASTAMGVNVETDIETGRWTHVVMMQEGDVMRIYIDGVLSGEADNIRLDPYEIKYTIPYCYIGKSQWSSDKYFDGAIDEFMIYDRALSEYEVAELFETEFPVTCNVSEKDGVYTVEFVKMGTINNAFTATFAQYTSGNVLTSEENITVDFSESDSVTVTVEKTGDTYNVSYSADDRLTVKTGDGVTLYVNGKKATGDIFVREDDKLKFVDDNALIIKTDNGCYLPNSEFTISEDTDFSSAYPVYETGVEMVNGAQVRVGSINLSEGEQIDAMSDSGLRFIATADYNDTLVAIPDVEFGIKIRAEGSSSEVYVPAEKFQNDDKTLFSAAITKLSTNNYNRRYTASAYVKVKTANGDEKEFTVGEVSRSIYQVSVGIMKNSSAEADSNMPYTVTDAVKNVLNSYINQTGIRITYKSDGSVGASDKYTGDLFFDVSYSPNPDNSTAIVITPLGQEDGFYNQVKLADWWKEYVRINNNNSVAKYYIRNARIEDNVLMFDFKIPDYEFDCEDNVMVVSSVTEDTIEGYKEGVLTQYTLTEYVDVVGLSESIEDVVPGSVVLIGTNEDGDCGGIELLASLGMPVNPDLFANSFGVYESSDGNTKYKNIVTEMYSKSGTKVTTQNLPDTTKTTYSFQSGSTKCYRVGIAMNGETPSVTVTGSKISAYPSIFESTANYHNYLYMRYNSETGKVTECVFYCVPKDFDFTGDGEYSDIFSLDGYRVIIE